MVSKNITTILMLILGVVLIAGCNADVEKTTSTDSMQVELAGEEDQAPGYTKEMVAEHDTPEDCWVMVEDGVYDISPLIGQIADQGTVEACGRTMDLLLVKEKLNLDNLQEARGRLQDYYLGDLN